MSTVNVLKITHNENTVLISINATQNILPVSEHKIVRNISNQPIDYQDVIPLKCVINTSDKPNVNQLNVGKKYTIYSIVEFNSLTIPESKYVPDSLIKTDIGYTYRPILETILTDFECIQNRQTCNWKLIFETI